MNGSVSFEGNAREEKLHRVRFHYEDNPVCVIPLDAFLVAPNLNRKRRPDTKRVLRTSRNLPSCLLSDDVKLMEAISCHSEVVLATDYRSLDIVSGNLPARGPIITGGGFTIEDRLGISDQGWRGLLERSVRHDGEIFEEMFQALIREFGPNAYLNSKVEQDGLPYAFFISNDTDRAVEMIEHTENHELMRDFTPKEIAYGTLFRRKSVNLSAAVNFLISSRPDTASKRIFKISSKARTSAKMRQSAEKILRQIDSDT